MSTEILIGCLVLLIIISVKFSYLYSTIILVLYHIYIDKKQSNGNKIVFELLYDGNRYFSKGEIIKAKKKYSQIQLFDPDSMISKIKIGYCHYILGEFSKALQIFETIDATSLKKTNKWIAIEIGKIIEIKIKSCIEIGDIKKAEILFTKFGFNERIKANLLECKSWLFYIKNEIDKSIDIINGRSIFKNQFIDKVWETETRYRDGMILQSSDQYYAMANFEECVNIGTKENYFYTESKKMIEVLSTNELT